MRGLDVVSLRWRVYWRADNRDYERDCPSFADALALKAELLKHYGIVARIVAIRTAVEP